MKRRTQMDYQCPSGKHSDFDYEFAYELGAEVMMNNMQRKDEYLKKQNERNNLETAKEFDLNRQKRNENQKNVRNLNNQSDRMENAKEFNLNKQNQRQKSNQQNNRSRVNRVEFSNNENMRPLKEEYYASQEYEPMDEHENFLLEKQNHKNDKNFRKR